MMGDLSILAVGLVMGVAIAWVLPGLQQLRHSAAARAAPPAEKPPGEPVPGAGPKNDQPSLRHDERGCAPPVGKHPFARLSQNSFWGGIARISWIDFFESKGFGASFGGLVSVLTFQMAGANALSTFALTLLIVVGYWLAFDKPR
jgi:hypothetical protein